MKSPRSVGVGRVAGCVLGTALGDAVGLPREEMSRRRGRRVFGETVRQALVVVPGVRRLGMVSDDTEHTILVLRALLVSDGDVRRFRRAMAWGLRWWVLRLPAGVGFGTLRACVKLWLFVPPTRSGVGSAGNGPAMRAAVIGVLAEDGDEVTRLTEAATTLTHTDPRALQGALLVAHAARHATLRTPDPLAAVLPLATDEGLRANLLAVRGGLAEGLPDEAMADRLGLSRGVSGFVNHTVPVALFCWLRHRGDYRAAVSAAVNLGGDTDTVAAITGALAGTDVGEAGLPADWLAGLAGWPWTVGRLRRLAGGEVVRVNGAFVLLRNVVFLAVVFAHALRRLLPPY